MEVDNPDGQPPLPGAEDAPPVPTEAAAGAAENGSKEEKRRSSRDRSRSRSRGKSRDKDREGRRKRSRSRERKRRSRSRSRDRDRDSRRPRSRSRERRDSGRDRRSGPGGYGYGYGRGGRGGYSPPRDSRRPARRRSPTPPEVRAERERAAELEALDRDTRTVFAYNLPLKATEKEIFAFFIRAGPLNDIKVITDKTTGRSKGFAYIEFQTREDVIGALALTGQVLMGQPVMVKMSEAEKNLAWEAWEAAKKQQRELGLTGDAAALGMLPGMPDMAPAAGLEQPTGPARLILTNLPPQITEEDLQPIFEPFGAVDFVRLQRDPEQRPTGTGFVQYTLLSDATKAKENLHGLDIVGYTMGVTWTAVHVPIEALVVSAGAAPPPMPAVNAADVLAQMMGPGGGLPLAAAAPPPDMPVSVPESLTETAEGGGIKLTGQSRAALMTKLAANAGLDVSNVPQIPLPQQPQGPAVPDAVSFEQGVLGPASPIPTQCLLLKNMFAPEEETAEDWDKEIAEEVGGECSKYGSVTHVWVDRASRGFVYLKFGDVGAATNAQRALHGRWFAGRQVVADFQFAQPYNQHFGL